MPNRTQVIHLNLPVGTRRLRCWSGTGWAILSQLGDEAIDRLIEKTLSRVHGDSSAGKMTKEKILAHVRDARKHGYALSIGTVTTGAGVIAMPLPLSASGMRLAIAAGGVSDRLIAHKAEIVKAMIAHVKTYTKSLKPPAAPRR